MRLTREAECWTSVVFEAIRSSTDLKVHLRRSGFIYSDPLTSTFPQTFPHLLFAPSCTGLAINISAIADADPCLSVCPGKGSQISICFSSFVSDLLLAQINADWGVDTEPDWSWIKQISDELI